jgi:hypothetical protein
MKKKLIITESQYRRLINEQDDYTEQLLSLINSNDETNLEMVKEMLLGFGIDNVQFLLDNFKNLNPPYFYKFEMLGIPDNKIGGIIKYIFGYNIQLKVYPDSYLILKQIQLDRNSFIDKSIYSEKMSDHSWIKREYDKKGEMIYYETSDGDIRRW